MRLSGKNLISHPLKPMLRMAPILDYDVKAWCCNHIWVHKQPLFLWQMAVSMKIFGVSVPAMRFPSVILGTLMVAAVYDITRMLTQKPNLAYFSALLLALSHYHLEMTAGRMPLDHNDLVFASYVTFGFWSVTKYYFNPSKKWAVIAGLFVGCAILVKWLTALVVIGAFGLSVLLNKERVRDISYYWHISLAVIAACIVFLPWQFYIHTQFPAETAAMHELNFKHISEVLDGHAGGALYHLKYLGISYGIITVLLVLIGFVSIWLKKHTARPLIFSFLASIAVVFIFFSVFVKTKMPGLVYPIAGLMYVFAGFGIGFLLEHPKIPLKVTKFYWLFALFILGFVSLRPHEIVKFRSLENTGRNIKIHDTKIIQTIPLQLEGQTVVFNAKPFQDVEIMFFTDLDAYSWLSREQIQKIKSTGAKIAVFDDHGGQLLEPHIRKDDNIFILDGTLKH